jgi:hypothetical protein
MYFVDVDVICKLAHWDILPHLPDLLGCQWNQIATVSSLRYRAQRAIETPDGKLFFSSAAAFRVVECIRLMSAMPAPDAAVLEDLNDIAQVDPGEAVLIAVTLGDPAGVFITGDKRALRALAQHPLAARLAGKVVLVEQVLQLCLNHKGREWLLASIREHRTIDKAISMIVGSRCDASLENLSAGLCSYIREIGNLCHPSMIANDITLNLAPAN